MHPALVKVLHIEDDPLYASLMHAILKDDGFNSFDVVHVDSLKKALCELKNKGFGAVLLDLSLPDVCGLDNVRAIREENPDMPIIVITGMDNDQMAMKALDEGAQDFIVKGHANNKVIQLAIKSSIKRKAFERDLYQRANYDEMTGLLNRQHFLTHLECAINKAKRAARDETVLFIDVDHFKQIDDMFGHAAGNAVLKEIGSRMKNSLREADIIARYGGDEFVILLDASACENKFSWAHTVSKLQAILNKPIIWKDTFIEVTTSIGVAQYPEFGEDAGTLLEYADKAMYEAKKRGGQSFRFAAV